ncbi:hypothetical protein GBA52_012263 [Prunus armeniaca]|nr:hypothetical protein GBA52_012263 [Prunus armeniaca]
MASGHYNTVALMHCRRITERPPLGKLLPKEICSAILPQFLFARTVQLLMLVFATGYWIIAALALEGEAVIIGHQDLRGGWWLHVD